MRQQKHRDRERVEFWETRFYKIYCLNCRNMECNQFNRDECSLYQCLYKREKYYKEPWRDG